MIFIFFVPITSLGKNKIKSVHMLPIYVGSLPSCSLQSTRGRLTCIKETGSEAAAAKLLQSCPTLCDPIDGSPPGSPLPGILQARTLEWVAISFSNAVKWKVKAKSLSRVRLLATPWTAAHQAPPSMGFSRQEYWSGVPLPSPAMNLGLVFQNSGYVPYLVKIHCWAVPL